MCLTKFGSEAPTKIYLLQTPNSIQIFNGKIVLNSSYFQRGKQFQRALANDYRLKMSKMIPSRGANSCIDMVNFKTNF